jgi:hypothetical protein
MTRDRCLGLAIGTGLGLDFGDLVDLLVHIKHLTALVLTAVGTSSMLEASLLTIGTSDGLGSVRQPFSGFILKILITAG